MVTLTPAGRTLLTHLRTRIDEVQERFLAGLSKREQETLMDLLVRLLEHADKTDSGDDGAGDPDGH